MYHPGVMSKFLLYFYPYSQNSVHYIPKIFHILDLLIIRPLYRYPYFYDILKSKQVCDKVEIV